MHEPSKRHDVGQRYRHRVGAFYACTSLREVYFEGNAPSVDSSAFSGDNNAIVYYLREPQGWENFGQLTGCPTVLWLPQVPNQ